MIIGLPLETISLLHKEVQVIFSYSPSLNIEILYNENHFSF